MKMIIAILNADDAPTVINSLMKNGFSITKLATTGGFLRTGNVTVLLGVDDDKVETALSVIKSNSHSRKQMIPNTSELGIGFFPSVPVEISIGGATVFVMDVERFEKI